MSNHPGLRDYLANHPGVRQDLRDHPYRFMGREDQLNGWHGPSNSYGRGPLGTTDNFLSSHPEVEQQLNQNPKLIDNPQYVADHPGLHEYLQNHPEARNLWRSHPYGYMQREDRFQKTH